MVAISLFTLGGTIAMRDEGGGARPALGPAELMAGLDLDPAHVDLTAEAVVNLPSGHLTLDDIYDLARRIRAAIDDGAEAVVVTQGTDTLEETAFALDLLLDVDQPIVITGAMRAASTLGTDGPTNLHAAILTAADPTARGRGVLVVLNDSVHGARGVTKAHTSRVDAFRTRDGGPIGLIAEGRIVWAGALTRSPRLVLPLQARARVPVYTSYLGDDGVALLALAAMDLQGLVVEGFGGGHVPPALGQTLESVAAQVPVVLASRCAEGPVLTQSYGYAGSERDLIARGLIPAGNLAGVKARLALTILLDGGADLERVKAFFAAL
ncbi:asparaginase [Govanella unica]|uniref:Asparaginase n=1 Tax=Govanella unica TaxID=2975056 RepID=A0A9X3Z5V5_9PROT|nr:asparaginase [Govania unica]MDA5192525.1 asparaginase [Govania unica]